MKKTSKVLEVLKLIDDLRLSPDELLRLESEVEDIVDSLPEEDEVDREEDKDLSFKTY